MHTLSVVFISIAAASATLLGGLFALRMRDRMHLIVGFAAGAVIGVAFFDLMPEAIALAGSTPAYITGLMALGFALYLMVDRAIVLHRHHDDAHPHAHSERGTWGAITLTAHSFIDGVGMGFAFQVSLAAGFVVAAAVLAHDFSDGVNTVSMIIKNGGTRARAIRYLILDAFAPVCGVLSTTLFSISETRLGALLAFFAGFFLYIGASDLLPESHHAHPVRWTTISTVLGMGFLFLVVYLAK